MLADSTYFSSLHSHLVLFPLLPNFRLSSGKTLTGVRSASDTPEGVLPFTALPQRSEHLPAGWVAMCRAIKMCQLAHDSTLSCFFM